VSLLGALCLPLQPSWGGFRWLAMVLGVFGFLTWKLWPHLTAMLAR
jgi:hypothetical protein